MNIFSMFGGARAAMDDGVEEFRKTEGAVLMDVRTPGEFASGHIPGSVNLPLDRIQTAGTVVPAKDTPLFVYCRSGARSGQAVSQLSAMGYTRAKNIGGIMDYSGPVER